MKNKINISLRQRVFAAFCSYIKKFSYGPHTLGVWALQRILGRMLIFGSYKRLTLPELYRCPHWGRLLSLMSGAAEYHKGRWYNADQDKPRSTFYYHGIQDLVCRDVTQPNTEGPFLPCPLTRKRRAQRNGQWTSCMFQLSPEFIEWIQTCKSIDQESIDLILGIGRLAEKTEEESQAEKNVRGGRLDQVMPLLEGNRESPALEAACAGAPPPPSPPPRCLPPELAPRVLPPPLPSTPPLPSAPVSAPGGVDVGSKFPCEKKGFELSTESNFSVSTPSGYFGKDISDQRSDMVENLRGSVEKRNGGSDRGGRLPVQGSDQDYATRGGGGGSARARRGGGWREAGKTYHLGRNANNVPTTQQEDLPLLPPMGRCRVLRLEGEDREKRGAPRPELERGVGADAVAWLEKIGCSSLVQVMQNHRQEEKERLEEGGRGGGAPAAGDGASSAGDGTAGAPPPGPGCDRLAEKGDPDREGGDYGKG